MFKSLNIILNVLIFYVLKIDYYILNIAVLCFKSYIFHYNSRLTENLVTNFDTERCCLMLPKTKQEIFLEAIDVHLAYGLPLGGKRIEQPNDESNLKWSKFLKAWRSKFGLKKV